jgi:hypothetical protein
MAARWDMYRVFGLTMTLNSTYYTVKVWEITSEWIHSGLQKSLPTLASGVFYNEKPPTKVGGHYIPMKTIPFFNVYYFRYSFTQLSHHLRSVLSH